MGGMHMITGSSLIGGQWMRPSAGETFRATDPVTGAALDPAFASSGPAEAEAAVRAAKEAFDASLELPPNWQAGLLDRIAANVLDLGDALLERGERETALPRARLTGERARTVGQLKFFAEVVREGSWRDAVIDTADPNRQPLPKPDVRRTVRPRGPTVVFGASNFPFAFGVLGGDTASALAAGNSVVAKGHPSHPGVSELMAAAAHDAIASSKLPAGLFNLLQGPSIELGAALVTHELVEAVGFTGSLKAGRALFDLAARRSRPIPVYAEMGSVNPVVVVPGALRERSEAIAKGLAGSVLLGVGQFCTKPGLVFVVGDGAERFIDQLAGQVRAAAAQAMTMLNQRLRDSFCSLATSVSTVTGVRTVVGGSPAAHAGVTPSLYATTAATFLNESSLHEELFGPGAIVVECTGPDELARCTGVLGGSLTASLHVGTSDDVATTRAVLVSLERIAGRIVVNGYPTGVEVNHAMVHGGPYPATTDPNSTSVGSAAIRRFTRLVAYQDTPDHLLPPALQNANPLGIRRLVDGQFTRSAVEGRGVERQDAEAPR